MRINIKNLMKHYNVVGLSMVVIEDSQISNTECFGVLEAGTNKNVEDRSIFNACSISKFLTSILVLILTEQGLLNLDEDVNLKLKSWKVNENDLTKQTKVTLRNLLGHQSGIIDPEGSFAELTTYNGVPSMVDLLEGKTPYCNVPIEITYTPESDFQYSDAGFCIIQKLIEDITGKPFKEVMFEKILQPLKMNNSTYEITTSEQEGDNLSCGHNENGEIVNQKYPYYPYPAAAGLWTTPSDIAILIIELMNSLKGESKIGLSASKAKEVVKQQGGKEWTGLGVFLDKSGRELEMSSLGWGVGFQSMMVAYPFKGSGLIIMTNTDLGVHQMKGIIGEIYHSYAT